MNSLLWQGVCVAILTACVVWNRLGESDPRWPLVGLGFTLFLWLLLGIYVIGASLWSGNAFHVLSAFSGTTTTTGTMRAGASILPMASFLMAFIPVALWLSFIVAAQRVPPIHDVSTDTNQPPALMLAEGVRHSSHNSVEYEHQNIPKQRKAYPEIQPLTVALSPEEAVPTVIESMDELGWRLHRPLEGQVDMLSNNKDLLIEAYDKTAVLGFVDDIVVRIRAVDAGSQIDIRSASRIGQSDFGANAQRIQRFLKAINKRVTGVQ